MVCGRTVLQFPTNSYHLSTVELAIAPASAVKWWVTNANYRLADW